MFERSTRFEQTGRLPVLVRFVSAPSPEKLESLHARSHGAITFDRSEPLASGAWQATVDEDGLHELAADADVARVSVDLRHRAPRPLDQSQIETNAIAAKRAAIAKDGNRLDGKGTIIADIDSPLFLHHPAFFHADGGAFAWVDVNNDKKLTPGKDGVDLDGSGTIEPGEVLHAYRSQAISRYTRGVIDEHDDFKPELDYLYLDTNGNGERDHGPKGFTEATPAYGEPLFVFDDANHDGEMQLTERVLQLKTSKIKMVESQEATYTRGKSGSAGLLAYDPEATPELAAAMGHATGVAGILVGGVPGVSKWIGLAPEADLIVNDSTSQRGMASAVQWAIDHKADVILTEYAPYTGVSLDGSSEDETILDAANDKGIVTVSPAGNLAGGHKHRTVTLSPGTTNVAVGTNLDSRYAAISLHYKGASRGLGLKLKRPDGTTVDVPESSPQGTQLADGAFLYVTTQTTPRGTHERFVYLIGKTTFAAGAYNLALTLDAGAPLEVDMFASDELSSWSGGFSFDEDTPTRTICSPSTSDKTISVAAYVLHDEQAYYPAGKKGDVASYSSRGPRFDGTPGIEIGAPDNPLSAAPPAPKGAIDDPGNTAVWEPFGGTSGAGPHVTAAVVLVKQAFPQASASDIKKKLLDGAKHVDGVSETTIGKGKLDIAKAIGGVVASGDAPKAKLDVVTPAHPGQDATVRVSATDNEAAAALTARWDLDYDGTFDTEWLPLGDQVVAVNDAAVGARLAVKVEVRDGEGNINGATALVDVTDSAPAAAAPSTATGDSDDGCGCRVVTGSSSRTSIAASAVGLAIALASLRRRRRLAVAKHDRKSHPTGRR